MKAGFAGSLTPAVKSKLSRFYRRLQGFRACLPPLCVISFSSDSFLLLLLWE
jgi:hypothetical protein